MLGFESLAECGSFLRLHGIEYEDETVFLERGTFMYPESAPPMFRSITLIGSKKGASFGEVMNGGPLNDNPYMDYFPHDSFDDDGFLKVESYEAKDQEVVVWVEKCHKLHVGMECSFCPNLYVDNWKVAEVEEVETGITSHQEYLDEEYFMETKKMKKNLEISSLTMAKIPKI